MNKVIKNNILAVRLYENEDVISSLSEAFKDAGKPLGIVLSGVGMMKNIKLGYFVCSGAYKESVFDKPREIVSFTGNFVSNSGRVFTHLHTSLADDNGKVVGGHLIGSRIHGTGEMFMCLSDIQAAREKEEETGLEGLQL